MYERERKMQFKLSHVGLWLVLRSLPGIYEGCSGLPHRWLSASGRKDAKGNVE